MHLCTEKKRILKSINELTDELGQEDDKKRCDEVVDPLDVTAGWMTDGPDKQNPLKHLKTKWQNSVLKEHHVVQNRTLCSVFPLLQFCSRFSGPSLLLRPKRSTSVYLLEQSNLDSLSTNCFLQIFKMFNCSIIKWDLRNSVKLCLKVYFLFSSSVTQQHNISPTSPSYKFFSSIRSSHPVIWSVVDFWCVKLILPIWWVQFWNCSLLQTVTIPIALLIRFPPTNQWRRKIEKIKLYAWSNY